MVHVSVPARILTALLAILLVLPVATIPLQDTSELEKFHNRVLRKWPSAELFLVDPARFFKDAAQWIGDRANPIIGASILHKKMLYYVLHSPPERRVSLGKNGYAFMNGGSELDVNGMLEQACVKTHGDEYIGQLVHNLSIFRKYGAKYGVPIYVVIVPILPSLYGDYLPRSVPRRYREACMARSLGYSPLPILAARDDTNLIYPMAEMRKLRDDPAFFPKSNFHADGLSVKTIREAFLKKTGYPTTIRETMELGSLTSEVLRPYGILEPIPVYVIYSPGISNDDAASARFVKELHGLWTYPPLVHVYANPNEGVSPKTVLMVSDSFGGTASRVFSGAFKRLIWLFMNLIAHDKVDEAIARVSRIERPDVIVLLVNEGGLEALFNWGKALSKHVDH
jgi:hypothetical protein